MPITCAIPIPRLSTDEFRALDYGIMRHAFASHTELGRLADEKIYQADFSARLVSAGYAVQREVPLTATFGSFSKTYYLDMVVNDQAIYELKTVAGLAAEHEGQLMNYLLMADCGHAKLVNFRSGSVQARFINAPMTGTQRQQFSVIDQCWRGGEATRDRIIELLRDWGTALELPLYYQAVIHLLGGEAAVTRQLPMLRAGISLGTQRFHLIGPDAFLRITAFNEAAATYESQLKRLLNCSPLKAAHWINIGHQQVTFTTVP